MARATTPDADPWGRDWSVGLRVWAERRGRAVLGPGRLDLLEAIDRCRSISAAARQLGMSYRRAWLLVQSVNGAAGEELVSAATGGAHGGGAQLTPSGRRAVAVFRRLQDELRRSAAALLPRLVRPADSAVVHLAAAVSLDEVVGRLLADFALRQPAVRVRAVFGASDELADHLLAGAPGELFLSADPAQIDRLESAGLLRPGSRAVLAGNGLAAVAPADRELPVRRPADLARPEVRRLALAGPSVPLGGYTRRYLEGLGLAEALLPRALTVDSSRSVVAAVEAGRADVGLVYSSDAARAAGCRTLFRVRPPEAIRYDAAVLARGEPCPAAGRLIEFLTSPAAAPRFRHCGFHFPRRRPR
jgi:molybdenum ABC transporter molybdate-binding protein